MQISYSTWSERLCARFFRSENKGSPVILAIDEQVLAEVAGSNDQEAAVESLCEAVKSRLGNENSDRLFESIWSESVAWRNSSPEKKCPPALPLLAVAVLAATRMQRTGRISAHNYYVPFRNLLDLQNDKLINSNYEYVPMLWEHLNWWLDKYKGGALGNSSARQHPKLTNIGYALSQALFRESDRQRLSHFFQWIELKPGEQLDPEELISYFKAWALRSARLSPGAQLMVREEAYADQLKSILQSAASTWDGTLRDETGRKLARIVLTLELSPRQKMGLAAERPRDFPEEGLFRSDQGSVAELRSSVEGWYDAFPIAISDEVLRNGLKFVMDDYALTYRPDGVVPFRQNQDLGCWASVRKVAPLDTHWLLVSASTRSKVETYLQNAADPRWAEFSRPGVAPRGWILLRDVIFNNRPSGISDPTLERLIPSVRERPTLWGGLPLGAGRNVYLSQGEPDLWIPPGPVDEPPSAILVDGRTEAVPGEGGVIELSGRGLAEGAHELAIGPAKLTFTTIHSVGARQVSGTAHLAHNLRGSNERFIPSSIGAERMEGEPLGETVRVAGASIRASKGTDLPTSRRPPVLAPIRAAEAVLFGSRPGEFQGMRAPKEPVWLKRVGLIPFGFEIYPEFDVVWACFLVRGEWKTRLKSSLNPHRDVSVGANSENVRAWRALLLKLPPPLGEDAELWNEYKRVAEQLDD